MIDSSRQILEHVRELMWARWKGHDRELLLIVIRRLMLGRSIDIKELGADPELTPERVRMGLESGRYEVDEDGKICEAFGVTVRDKLPFTVRHGDASVRVCCGLVAIIVARLSADSRIVSSQDPTTGKTIRQVMERGIIVSSRDLHRVRAVLVAPAEEAFLDNMWNTFCRFIRFYESADTLPDLTDLPASASSVSLDNMIELASSVSECLWGEACLG